MLALGPPATIWFSPEEQAESNVVASTLSVARPQLPPLETRGEEVGESQQGEGGVLALECCGTYLLCVSSTHVSVLSVNESLDWTLVGSSERPPLASSVQSAAWNPDGSSFVVCNALGIAEFYDVTPLSNKQAVRLGKPKWARGEASQSGEMVKIIFRCAVNSTVDGEHIGLLSAEANRMWLLMGTDRGTVIRVLWTGEIVPEKEVALFDNSAESNVDEKTRSRNLIVQVCVGFQQRIGFLCKDGTAGVVAKDGKAMQVGLNCTSIAMHQSKPLVAVGDEAGSVTIFNVGKATCKELRTIAFPSYDLPPHLTDKPLLRSTKAASSLQWCPDGSDFLAAGYADVGYMIWSLSGVRTVTAALSPPSKLRGVSSSLGHEYQPIFAWTLQGYNLLTRSIQRDLEKPGRTCLSSFELVKSCSLCGTVVSGSTSMHLQGWNYVLALQNQDWAVKSLAWQRINLPPVYLKENWPIRHVAVSLNGNYVAVAGSHGIAVFSKITKRWKLLEDYAQEKSVACKNLFWWGDEILCLVTRDSRARSWELVCLARDRLDLNYLLGKVALPARPTAVDTWFEEGIVVFQMPKQLALYHLQLFHQTPESSRGRSDSLSMSGTEDSASASEGEDDGGSSARHATGTTNAGKGTKKLAERKHSLYVIRRASSVSTAVSAKSVDGIFIRLVETVALDVGSQEDRICSTMCLMPCGATRRAGSSVKFPKCVVLFSDGTLSLVDMDEGTTTFVAQGISQIIPQSWSKIDQADDVVLDSFLELSAKQSATVSSTSNGVTQVVPKLPSVLLYSIWVLDDHGMRLWLPALDIGGEFLSTRCTDAFSDIIPIGILESHGLVIGLTQRSRPISKIRLPCFEISIRVTPTTHAILSWLVQAERVDLAAQVILQASTHLPLFRETLDLFLFNTVETDYANGKTANVLKRAINLLRTGKITTILDPRTYDSLVVTCARKMEASRWPLFFSYAANPEQLFNDAIYNGDLQTAAGSMIIADHFNPAKSSKRIASLTHAATVNKDDRLLQQIHHFQRTKLV